MRYLKICVLFIALLICVSNIKANAENLEDSLNIDSLYQSLDNTTLSYLDMAEIDENSVSSPDYEKIFDTFKFIFEDNLPLVTGRYVIVSVVLILASMLMTFESGNTVSDFAFTAVSAGMIYPALIEITESVKITCGALSVFIKSSVPVYAGIVTFSGKAATGSAYTTLTLIAAQITDFIVTSVALPMVPLMLILCLASGVTGRNFEKINDNIQKAVKWALVFTVTVFSAVTSLQTIVTSGTDALAMKNIRLAVSTAVPIVGSALGDALSAVNGSIAVIKSGAGAFGILAVIFIFAPSLIKCSLNLAALFCLTLLCDLFNMHKINSVIKGCMSVYKLLIACSFTLLAVSVISAAILIALIK